MSSITSGQDRVAVLGLGLAGVTALKNLREEGFDAIGIERNDQVGGLWVWSQNPAQTTVLKTTVANLSKQKNAYTDYPFPDDVPSYPSAAQMAEYIQSYWRHFDLEKHSWFGVQVEHVDRSKDGRQWSVKMREKGEERTELFDRLLVTSGTFQTPMTPKYEGMDVFKGQLLHAQGFKDREDFRDKRTVVVGMSQTAGDVAVDLADVARKTFVSHRSGVRIMTRQSNGGKPLDHRATRRMTGIGLTINSMFPAFAGKLGAYMVERQMRREFRPIDPAWLLSPAPPIFQAPPTMNDRIISCFRSGSLISKPGVERFQEHAVEFTDGTVEPADAVIFCTGYQFDYSIFAPEANPTASAVPEWDSHRNSNGLAYPRLYQGLFPPRYSDSLAFIGPMRGHSASAFSNSDVSAQAITQVWKGGYKLPSTDEMEAWCTRNYQEQLALLDGWHLGKVGVPAKPFERWLNEASGNGMNEKLGWTSLEAWKFWWKDRKLYSTIMDGIDTPFVYRLFDGRRKRWDGARAAIENVNSKH